MGDPHAVLGVEPGADPEALLRAFRRQAKRCHPDLHPFDVDAAARFRAVVAAYQFLCRAAVDGEWTEPAVRVVCLASGADLFGALPLSANRGAARVLVQLEALWPCTVCDGCGQERIAGGWGRIELWECETCGGAGVRRLERRLFVRIPASCGSGERLRLASVGLPRIDGTNGDAILVVRY